MPALKRSFPSNRKNEKKSKLEPAMDLSLPSDEWFEEMWPEDDAVILSNKSPAPKTGHKKRKTKVIKQKKVLPPADFEVIEISDGEELYQAFPLSENNLKGEEKAVEEGVDFIVLYESIKSPKKEIFDQQDTTASGEKPKELDLTSPKSRIKEIDWKKAYGVNLRCNRNIMKKISNYREKFPKQFSQFEASIWKHMTDNIQNDHTYTWKMRLRNVLNDIIREIFPEADLVAVGSTVNGCGAFNSDMDLCLCLCCRVDGYETARSYAISRLKKVLKRLIKEKELVKYVQYIPAKVPILNINFHEPYQTLEVDINVNNIPGIYNSYLLHHYSRIDDRFPTLCLLVKHWAKSKGILDACSGYFNSYSLILMTLHFLQCATEPPILPNLQAIYPEYFAYGLSLRDMNLFNPLPHPLPEVPQNNQTIGELIIAFFTYFYHFDFKHDAISVRQGRSFKRYELAANTERFKVFIEEPFDFQNTARCVTNEDQWQLILKVLRDTTVAVCTTTKPPNLKNLI